MPRIYALVFAAGEQDFDSVAELTTEALVDSGVEPLFLSNPMRVTDREAGECDFETHVFSHGSYCDTLDANDEPRDEQSTLEHLTRLATSALGAVRDQVGEESWEDNTPSRVLGRALDAWDEFVQMIDPEED